MQIQSFRPLSDCIAVCEVFSAARNNNREFRAQFLEVFQGQESYLEGDSTLAEIWVREKQGRYLCPECGDKPFRAARRCRECRIPV